MAARVTRAKKKISAARIAYRVPAAPELPDRLDAVLTVIHLLYTTGHTAPTGADLVRPDLVDRAIGMARMVHELMPDEREVRGCWRCCCSPTPGGPRGWTARDGWLLLKDQDRSTWDQGEIAEGTALVVAALRGALQAGRPGRFALQAAIAAVHAEAPSYAATDWPELLALYDLLLRAWPSPVVALNRAVVVSMIDGPAAGLADIARLEEQDGPDARLAGYHYLPAAKADLLRQLGRAGEAEQAYREALELADNEAERAFLAGQIVTLSHSGGADPAGAVPG